MVKISLLLFFAVYSVNVAAQRPTLILSKSEGLGTQDLGATILTKIYGELGYDTEFVELPPQRAVIWAAKGKSNADIWRLAGTTDIFPTLNKVEPEIINFHIHAYALEKDRERIDPKKFRDFEVGYVTGLRVFEEITRGTRRTATSRPEQLFEMLINERIDLFLYTGVDSYVIHQQYYLDSKIVDLGPVFHEPVPLYHYIHDDYKHLVPAVGKRIKEMRDSGEYRRLFEEYLTEYRRSE